MTATAPPSGTAPSPFEPGVGISLETADASLLGDALPGWDIEYIQLGHGLFHGHIELGQMGVPERTLHQAVRTHLGVTPKALLKTMRLNAVRQALRTAPPETGVMEIAMQWGFFHAGWFSQDYRQQFGESPSTTLRKGAHS